MLYDKPVQMIRPCRTACLFKSYGNYYQSNFVKKLILSQDLIFTGPHASSQEHQSNDCLIPVWPRARPYPCTTLKSSLQEQTLSTWLCSLPEDDYLQMLANQAPPQPVWGAWWQQTLIGHIPTVTSCHMSSCMCTTSPDKRTHSSSLLLLYPLPPPEAASVSPPASLSNPPTLDLSHGVTFWMQEQVLINGCDF